jgi:hypothetical protein
MCKNFAILLHHVPTWLDRTGTGQPLGTSTYPVSRTWKPSGTKCTKKDIMIWVNDVCSNAGYGRVLNQIHDMVAWRGTRLRHF